MEKDSKEKLLEAAAPLFAEKGFAAVSIRQVADAAGVNSALISYHFGGKSGLYEAVLEQQFSCIAERLEKLSREPLSPADKLRGYARAVVETHQQEPHLIRLWFREMTEPTSPFRHIIVSKIGIAAHFLQGAIVDGMACGAFRQDLVPEYALLGLAGMLNFFFVAKPIVQDVLPPDLVDDMRYAETMAELFIRSLA